MLSAKIQEWWWHRQGLDGQLAGQSAPAVLATAGWARSVAGAGPYLTFFSLAGLRRAEVDRSIAAMEIHELPSARGCTYVLPASDYALGLSVGQAFGQGEMSVARKLGVTDDEIYRLRIAVAHALKDGSIGSAGLRTAVGDAARSLGTEGVKKGIATTLPVALEAMQAAGEIRRIPVNGRLDQQRYLYALWTPNPLVKWKLTPAEAWTELARLFFRWTGGASPAQFQWFSGLGLKAASAALEPLDLQTLETYLMLPEDREAFEQFEPSKQPRYALIASLDSLGQLRRDLKSLLALEDWQRDFSEASGQGVPPKLMDMPSHAITVRGRVVGWWEFDTATATITWMSYIKPDAAMKDAIHKTEVFIREDLGDARSFSLDSPKSRIPKIEALRTGRLQ